MDGWRWRVRSYIALPKIEILFIGCCSIYTNPRWSLQTFHTDLLVAGGGGDVGALCLMDTSWIPLATSDVFQLPAIGPPAASICTCGFAAEPAFDTEGDDALAAGAASAATFMPPLRPRWGTLVAL